MLYVLQHVLEFAGFKGLGVLGQRDRIKARQRFTIDGRPLHRQQGLLEVLHLNVLRELSLGLINTLMITDEFL